MKVYGLKLSPEKCQFFQTAVRYLGHIVSQDGVETDPAKVEALRTWPEDFESHAIRELCIVTGIQKVRTTPYHPRGNPVERFNCTLLQMLGTLENENKSCWSL